MHFRRLICICSNENKRRTKFIPRSLDPEWHQTLVFMNIPKNELVKRILEITVWDFDRFKANDFMGCVIIDLKGEIDMWVCVYVCVRGVHFDI